MDHHCCTEASLSPSPSPFSSPRDSRSSGVVVPVQREDAEIGETVGVRVGSRMAASWTIADLKLGLKTLTGLSLHEQVIMFADHQLTDGIKVSKEDLRVVLENGGFFLRRRDQKCGSKRLFSKGIRSLSTFITRNYTNPAILQQQQDRIAQQQQLHQQYQDSLPPPQSASLHEAVEAAMHEADGNDSEEDCGNPGTVSYESDSMDSSDFTIYDALEYADLLRAGGVEAAMYSGGDVDSILSNGGVGSCSGSSCAVSASAKSIKVVSPTGTKRLWQGDSDDLDEEYEEVEESDHEEIQCESNIAVEEEEGDDGDDDEIDDASFGVNNVVDGSVFLDEESAKKIYELLGLESVSAGVAAVAPAINSAELLVQDVTGLSKNNMPCSVIGSAAEATSMESSPRKRVRAI